MMRVTKTTHGMLAKNRHEKNKKTVTLQRMTKKGWGKPFELELLYKETPEQAVERMIRNNGIEFRIAQ